MTIEAVLFDIGNTLVKGDFGSPEDVFLGNGEMSTSVRLARHGDVRVLRKSFPGIPWVATAKL